MSSVDLNKVVEFCYMGGSRPGSNRKVLVRKLHKDYVEGIDLELKEYRRYTAGKIKNTVVYETLVLEGRFSKLFDSVSKVIHTNHDISKGESCSCIGFMIEPDISGWYVKPKPKTNPIVAALKKAKGDDVKVEISVSDLRDLVAKAEMF